MESRTNQANRYRMEASKYAKLAGSDPPDMMGDVHRRLADRYIRMARDLERREKNLTTALALLNNQEYGGSHRRQYGAFFRALLRAGIWRRLVRAFGLCLAGIPTRKERITFGRHLQLAHEIADKEWHQLQLKLASS